MEIGSIRDNGCAVLVVPAPTPHRLGSPKQQNRLPVGTIQVRIHEGTGEAEISPFKTRRKLLTCVECGKNMVTEPVAEQMFKRVDFDWDEFRTLARTCPECRSSDIERVNVVKSEACPPGG